MSAAEAEAAAKSRAMQRLLRRPVWKVLLSQIVCLHELWPHHRHDAGPQQCCCILEDPHGACQQPQGSRNSPRMVSLLTSEGVDSEFGSAVRVFMHKMYNDEPHVE